jgi:hypothetical protein
VDERQLEVLIDNDDHLTSPIKKLVFEIGSLSSGIDRLRSFELLDNEG